MRQVSQVVVALKRPPGYEDVHPELVIEDAMRPDFAYEMVRDEGTAVIVAIERPEGYERSSASSVAKDAVNPSWPSWALVKQPSSASS
jgi:hypothetical protein